ncbi:MAG TPA: hypothetical protein VI278_18525 [Nitrososphaeraceae archaeon]
MQHALGVEHMMKITCPICKGSGKLPVTQQPKAEARRQLVSVLHAMVKEK